MRARWKMRGDCLFVCLVVFSCLFSCLFVG